MDCPNFKLRCKSLARHETKRHVLKKFLFVFVIFIAYFIFISQKYGFQQGLFVALLTWSFFVLCTPVADAGFLLDFPLRIITKLRMWILEIFVWLIAISLNLYAFFLDPAVYEKTKILILFKYILQQPVPFWSIIIISMIGTFVSIRFGDELLDKVNHKERKIYHKHKNNHKLIIMIFLFGISLILYDFLLKQLGVDLPL